MQIQQFMKDYKLPLLATILFFVIVLLMLLVRFYEQSVLAGVLDGRVNSSQDYASLLSVDKSDDLKKNNTDESGKPVAVKPSEASTPSQSSDPLTINPSGSASTTPTDSDGSPPSPPTNGDPIEPTPVPNEQFKAFAENTGLESEYQVCEFLPPNTSKCSKVYIFKGLIKTFNGPGIVGYSWRSTLAGFDQDSEFPAGPGETFTNVNKIIKLDCSQPVQFGIRLVIRSPNFNQSDTVNVSHSCD